MDTLGTTCPNGVSTQLYSTIHAYITHLYVIAAILFYISSSAARVYKFKLQVLVTKKNRRRWAASWRTGLDDAQAFLAQMDFKLWVGPT